MHGFRRAVTAGRGLAREFRAFSSALGNVASGVKGRPLARCLQAGRPRFLHSSCNDGQQALAMDQVAETREVGDWVVVKLADGSALEFPSVWLRDNCQCPACFNKIMNSRLIDWQTFDVDATPASVQSLGDEVSVSWHDGHQSVFTLDWLRRRAFTDAARATWLQGTYRPVRQPWQAQQFPRILHRFNFRQVLDSDAELLSWLEALAVHGVAIVEETPNRYDQIRLLANRVAFIKKTHYGEEFEVIAKPDTSNLAYLTVPLQLHTDLPYYQYKPGCNLLHCLVQAGGSGGANQLTDCLHISEWLKANDPETYRILTTTLVEWNDIGQDLEGTFHSIYRAPVLCLDREGEFERVNYSQQQRDSHFSVSRDEVIPWYKAHKKLTDLLHHPDNTVFFKTKPGEILTFDNVRMVHGRTGYDDVAGLERHLVGVYLDWDIVFSKIRVLRRKRDGLGHV